MVTIEQVKEWTSRAVNPDLTPNQRRDALLSVLEAIRDADQDDGREGMLAIIAAAQEVAEGNLRRKIN